jgi:hypothetical protein
VPAGAGDQRVGQRRGRVGHRHDGVRLGVQDLAPIHHRGGLVAGEQADLAAGHRGTGQVRPAGVLRDDGVLADLADPATLQPRRGRTGGQQGHLRDPGQGAVPEHRTAGTGHHDRRAGDVVQPHAGELAGTSLVDDAGAAAVADRAAAHLHRAAAHVDRGRRAGRHRTPLQPYPPGGDLEQWQLLVPAAQGDVPDQDRTAGGQHRTTGRYLDGDGTRAVLGNQDHVLAEHRRLAVHPGTHGHGVAGCGRGEGPGDLGQASGVPG